MLHHGFFLHINLRKAKIKTLQDKIDFLQCRCRCWRQCQCWCRDTDAEIYKWPTLSTLLFNLVINTLIKTIKQEKSNCIGYICTMVVYHRNTGYNLQILLLSPPSKVTTNISSTHSQNVHHGQVQLLELINAVYLVLKKLELTRHNMNLKIANERIN